MLSDLLMILILALLAVPFVWPLIVVRVFLRDTRPTRGSPMYDRDEILRPALARRGLQFKYWFYRAEDGSGLWIRQIRELGGPFRLLLGGLYGVYEGVADGDRVIAGIVSTGLDDDAREESAAAIFDFGAMALPTFTFKPREGFASTGNARLPMPYCPQLEQTYVFEGDDAAAALLSSIPLEDVEPGLAFEATNHKLVFLSRRSREASGFLTADEITNFLDKTFRIAASVKHELPRPAPAAAPALRIGHAASSGLPRGCGITVKPLAGGGETFRVRIRPTFSAVFWTLVILAVLNGMVAGLIYALRHSDTSAILPTGFLLLLLIAFDVVLIGYTIDYLIGSTVISVSHDGLRTGRTWLGLGRRRDYAATAIESLIVATAAPDGRTFGFVLKLRSGQAKTIAHYIGDRAHADAALATMLANLGRGGARSVA